MANFTPSQLVAGQAKFNEKFTSGEWRAPDSAALTTAVKGNVANPMLADLRLDESRSVNAYFPIRQAATNGTARAHNHAGARGDSLAEAISWGIFSEPFSISIKQANSNVFNFAEMYAASLRNATFNLINRLDAWFVAQLLAAKTNINVGGGNGTFVTGAGATQYDYTLAQTEKDYFFENIVAMMQQNLFNGGLTAIVDSRANVLARKVGNQGSGNNENQQYQLMGYDGIAQSTRTLLATPTPYTESAVVFESGLVGAIPWIPMENRKGLDPVLATSYNGDYGSFSIPDLGVDFAIHSYGARADNSALNGQTQDVTINVEVSVDFGFVPAPVSTFRGANDSVIFTAGVLA